MPMFYIAAYGDTVTEAIAQIAGDIVDGNFATLAARTFVGSAEPELHPQVALELMVAENLGLAETRTNLVTGQAEHRPGPTYFQMQKAKFS